MMKFNKGFNLRAVFILAIILLLSTPRYVLSFSIQKESLRVPLNGTESVKKALLPIKDLEDVSEIVESPSLEELESKIFAVHGTSILPENGMLKAGSRNISGRWLNEEPPSFKPTLHFSLGELIRGSPISHSWEKMPYAVICPLKSLTKQLVNVFPSDTFIFGDFQLSDESTLIVPKGTDISKIPKSINIVEYKSGVDLRAAVNQVIRAKEGWSIRLPEDFEIGSPAYMGDTNINSLEFFDALFKHYPHISYGDHSHSERGDGSLFGEIEEVISYLMRTYERHGPIYSTLEIKLYRSLIMYKLNKLERLIQAREFPVESIKIFAEKKERLLEWLNIVDVDLETRQTLRKTLADVPQEICTQILQKRKNPDELRDLRDQVLSELPDAIDIIAFPSSDLAQFLFSMSPKELESFIAAHQQVFDNTNIYKFYAEYAIRRWVVIKTRRARQEGLDNILSNAFEENHEIPIEGGVNKLFGLLEKDLALDSNRLNIVLDILRLPAIKEQLANAHRIIFEESGPQTLEDVLRAHPQTKIIFTTLEFPVRSEQETAYILLQRIREISQPDISEKTFKSFRDANRLSSDFQFESDLLLMDLDTVTKPMTIVRELDSFELGELPGLYERLRRDYESAQDLWNKVGLKKEFNEVFPDEELFWQSEFSFLEIYEGLQEIHRKGYKKSNIETLRTSI